MKRPIPWITLAVIAGALFIAAAPALQPLFIYEREKILAGELWRMFTGHLVHLSGEHLLWDIAAFAIVGSLIERQNRGNVGFLCLLAPCLISSISLVAEPQMHHYAGLSGLIMSAVVFLALRQNNGPTTITLLALVAAKITFELTSSASMFVASSHREVRVAAMTHLIGALLGAALALLIPSCLHRGAGQKQVPLK